MTTATATNTQVYQLFIKATPEQVWDGITKPEFTTRYFHGTKIDSTFEPGAPYLSVAGEGGDTVVDGEILESDPPRLLKHTWRALYDPETAAEPHSRVTWEIEPQEGGVTRPQTGACSTRSTLHTASTCCANGNIGAEVRPGLKVCASAGTCRKPARAGCSISCRWRSVVNRT
mgnify:CR=1 FL=1